MTTEAPTVEAAMLVLLSRSQMETVAEMTRCGYTKLAAVRRLISLGQMAYDSQEQMSLRFRPLSKLVVTLSSTS